jgi:hypothetical protein
MRVLEQEQDSLVKVSLILEDTLTTVVTLVEVTVRLVTFWYLFISVVAMVGGLARQVARVVVLVQPQDWVLRLYSQVALALA